MMKRILLPASLLLLALTVTAARPAAAVPGLAGTSVAAEQTQTQDLTLTIVRLDLATRTVVLKDQNGKAYTFTLPAQSGIDLSKFRVGQTVTASIVTTVSTDQVTRARISKTQLIKLQ
jgi:hypothetical protein